jgi:hypothetical protein
MPPDHTMKNNLYTIYIPLFNIYSLLIISLSLEIVELSLWGYCLEVKLINLVVFKKKKNDPANREREGNTRLS